MIDKELLGYISLLFTIISNGPYLYSVWIGKSRPHVFSLLVWTVVSAIASFAQYSANAGPGAWATGLTALCCFAVVLLSLRQKADWSHTRGDWTAFLGALAIIPLWYVTKNPLVAALLATLIDVLAYIPSFRKFYNRPHDDMIFVYFVANLKHLASILAIVDYSTTTLVFPVCVFVMNGLMIGMLAYRRRALARSQ